MSNNEKSFKERFLELKVKSPDEQVLKKKIAYKKNSVGEEFIYSMNEFGETAFVSKSDKSFEIFKFSYSHNAQDHFIDSTTRQDRRFFIFQDMILKMSDEEGILEIFCWLKDA